MKTKKQQIADFLKKTKKYHTAPQVAEKKGCSAVYVYANDEWKNHRGQFDKGTVDERVHDCLEKYGKTLPSLNTIAEECGCAVESAQRAPSYRERKVKPPSKKEKVKNFIRSVWNDSKRYTCQEVAEKCGCTKDYVCRLKDIWGRYYRRFKQQDNANVTGQSNSLSKPKKSFKSTIQNRARTLLFHKNGKPKLNKDTGKKFKLKEVLEFFECSRQAFREVWGKYQSSFPKRAPAGKQIKEVLFYKNGNPKLCVKTGKPFTKNEIAFEAGCSVATVGRYKKLWEKYKEKTQSLRPQGTTEERVEKALQELCAEGIVNPTLSQVSARAECSKAYICKYSPAWKNRHRLFPPLDERIEKALRELRNEGVVSPIKRQVAERARCSCASVQEHSTWKAHRQSPVPFPPIFTAHDGKGNRISASAVLEEYQDWIEEANDTANVNDREANDTLKRIENILHQRFNEETDTPSGKKRKRVSDEQYHEAIKYVIEEKMTQCEAEKKCGLPAGALSKGKGKKMLETVIREFADINRRKVSDVVGDDFRYNSTR